MYLKFYKMKNILATLIVLISCTVGAQEIEMRKGKTVNEIKKGAYYSFPELDNFTGTWKDVSGDSNYQIVILNKKTFVPGNGLNYHRDYLQGYSCDNTGRCSNDSKNLILSNGTTTTNESRVEFILLDLDKEKIATVTLELIPGDGNKAKWILNKGELRFNDDKKVAVSAVPSEITLTRVK